MLPDREAPARREGGCDRGGLLLAVEPWLALAAALVWAGIARGVRRASVASLAAVVGTLVAMVALRRPPVEVVVFAAVVAIVVARHRVNLAQLARGEERTLEAGPAVAPASEANGQRVGREDGDARPRG